ncbi:MULTISPECIES: MFS transporter [unclassified Streptomyces]|uniref:MFS transporter n=1 Tax=unclassified Streptomyces TaxID=2593676 RepID=UPI0004C66BC3|nr:MULTISPECIES: MFS transporter [unclassified Streptomyces]KOV83049.1 transporter [Streptomyces sp. NRRL WC-3723]
MSVSKSKENAAPGVLDALRATPRSVRYLLGGVLLNQLGAFVQTFLVLYLTHRGYGVDKAGFLLGAYGVGAVVGTVLGGELTSRLGSRNTITTAMSCSAVLVFLIPWLADPGDYPLLLGVVVVLGLMTQSYRPAASALLSDLMPDEFRVMGFSMLRIAMNIGAAAGPLLAAALIQVDWNLLFWVDGSTALAYALLAAALLPRPASAPGGRDPGAREAHRSAYGTMVRDHRFLLYLTSMLLSALVYAQFFAVLPVDLDEAGHSTSLYSGVLTLSSALLISFELAVTARISRWRASTAATVGTFVYCLGIAGYGLPGSVPALVLLTTAVSVGGLMISGPTLWAHPAKADEKVRGRYIAASQTVFGLGSAVGPALGMLMWTHYGDGVWATCAVLGTVAAALAFAGLRSSDEPPDAVERTDLAEADLAETDLGERTGPAEETLAAEDADGARVSVAAEGAPGETAIPSGR